MEENNEVVIFTEDDVLSKMMADYMTLSHELDGVPYNDALYDKLSKLKEQQLDEIVKYKKALTEEAVDKPTLKKLIFENSKNLVPTVLNAGVWLFATLLILGVEVNGCLGTHSIRKLEFPRIFKK